MTREESLKEAWLNACENGYEDWLIDADPLDVAIDMMDRDVYIEELFEDDFDELVSMIREIQLNGGYFA